jgi:hypothetical protein
MLLGITPQHCVIGLDFSNSLMSSYARTRRFENSKAGPIEEIYRHNVTGSRLALAVSGLISDLGNNEFEIYQRRLKSQYAFNRAGNYCKDSAAIYSS